MRTPQVLVAAAHHVDEGIRIVVVHRAVQAFHGRAQRAQRLLAIGVQALDLVVKVRVLGRHPGRDVELRIESRARHARKARRVLAALGERREERDIERVRQPEHKSDQAIVLVETHHHEIRHRGCEQRARLGEGRRVAEIDEDDVTTGKQFGVRAEHRMHRGHAHSGRPQRGEAFTQGRLQGPDIEDDSRRPALRQRQQDLIRLLERRRHDDQVVIEAGRSPVRRPFVARHVAGRVRDRDAKTLRSQEVRRPPAHLAATTDDERGASRPASLRGHPGLLLGRQRTPDQRLQDGLGQRGRHAQRLGVASRLEQDLALAAEIARRLSGGALDGSDLASERLPLGDQLEYLPVEDVETGAQFFK